MLLYDIFLSKLRAGFLFAARRRKVMLQYSRSKAADLAAGNRQLLIHGRGGAVAHSLGFQSLSESTREFAMAEIRRIVRDSENSELCDPANGVAQVLNNKIVWQIFFASADQSSILVDPFDERRTRKVAVYSLLDETMAFT